MSDASPAELAAATALHHQFFTGLILGLAGHHGLPMAAEFVYRTFRRQHEQRFVRGLERLGLSGLAPAVACGQFIYLSNRAGGLEVQYMAENERKVWVRYPPPRWAYEGPAICALDNSVSEAFLRGFHARCGMSLGNPRLRFVCTGMTTNGDPGLEGFFEEIEQPVGDDGRLLLRLGERGPAYDPRVAPALPWSAARMPVARRNYAVRYIQVMLPVVLELLGREEGAVFASRMGHLVGLQGYRDAVAALQLRAGGGADFIDFLAALNRGTGNAIAACDREGGRLTLSYCRIAAAPELFDCWSGLWRGALAVHAPGLRLVATPEPGWRVQ